MFVKLNLYFRINFEPSNKLYPNISPAQCSQSKLYIKTFTTRKCILFAGLNTWLFHVYTLYNFIKMNPLTKQKSLYKWTYYRCLIFESLILWRWRTTYSKIQQKWAYLVKYCYSAVALWVLCLPFRQCIKSCRMPPKNLVG